jgi:hypothetical protein
MSLQKYERAIRGGKKKVNGEHTAMVILWPDIIQLNDIAAFVATLDWTITRDLSRLKNAISILLFNNSRAFLSVFLFFLPFFPFISIQQFWGSIK